MHTKDYYIELRNRFLPECLENVFILESPPISGLYFYDTSGSTGEPLFTAMMNILSKRPENKEVGLELFANNGCFLVDATYTPVNNIKGSKKKDDKILENYDQLVLDLESLGEKKTINFILVKANVCRLLENKLLLDGFNVKNKGTIIPFPSNGQQNNFYREMKKVFIL